MVDVAQVTGWEYFNYIIAVTIVLLTPVVAKMILYVFERYLEPFAAKKKTNIYILIIGAIKVPTYTISFLFGLYLALWYVEFPWLDQFQVGSMVIGAIMGTLIAYSIIPALIKEYSHRLAKKTKSRVDEAMILVTLKVVRILIVVVGIMIILDMLGVDIMLILTGMGIAGLAVALAFRDTLSNMLSGFYLMVDKPFKMGDRLSLDTGEVCEVMDIGLRSTRLYNEIDHTLITIPTAELSKMKIVNISEPDIRLKVRIPIRVAYGSDINKVKGILMEIAKGSPDVLNDPPPAAFFMEFGEFSINLLLVAWIGDVKKKLVATDYLNCRIKERFEEENIEIPFPIRTIYMKGGK